MTTTHTAASLAALHADDPRKLDALAAEVVMGQRVEWHKAHSWVNDEGQRYIAEI